MQSWTVKITRASEHLRRYLDEERAWFEGVQDPLTYQTSSDGLWERYVAVLPVPPVDLSESLADALKTAREALDHLAVALARANNVFSNQVSFPFAKSQEAFNSPGHKGRLEAFAPEVREIFRDIGLYGGGDPLHDLHLIANHTKHIGLLPFATYALSDPPRVAMPHASPERLAKLPEIIKGVPDQAPIIPAPGEGWDAETNTLLIAQWHPIREVHVQANVQAYLIFPSSDEIPLRVQGRPASAYAEDAIKRVACLVRDLEHFAG